MHSLDGLLRRIRGGAAEVWQFHALIRRHCVRRRQRESPARYAAIHASLAKALAARGHTVEALRHAREADDIALMADILIDAGGVRLMLTRGVDHLAATLRLVPDSALERHPRLVPALSAAKASIGCLAEARLLLASVLEGPRDAVAGDDLELYLDRSWHARSSPTSAARPRTQTRPEGLPRKRRGSPLSPVPTPGSRAASSS